MLITIKEFNNGIEDCLIIDSNNNKKVLEKTNGVLYNNEVCIVKRRLNDYEESTEDKIELTPQNENNIQ